MRTQSVEPNRIFIMATNTWNDFFTTHLENKAGNKITVAYSTAWDHQVSNEAKLAFLNNDASIVVLAVDTNNKIIIIHSFRNLGGTIINPANTYGALIGNGRIASAVVINTASLLQHINITTPGYNAIIGCADKATIEALNRPAQHTRTVDLNGCASFLPAPWLLEAISGANTSDPALLILAAANAATVFNENHENDND